MKHLQVVPLGNHWGRKELGRVAGFEIRPLAEGLPVGPNILNKSSWLSCYRETVDRLLVTENIFFCIWQCTADRFHV